MSKFSCVEINNTFYQLPKEKIWKNWYERASNNFIYCIKLHRFITHMKKLKAPLEDSWNKFWKGASLLKEKLGPILIQLPDNFNKNIERLNYLSTVLPKNIRFAFEFRDKRWYDNDVYTILKNNIAGHKAL
jgi:uncharacterized protein YecE (DUF72 family)